MSELSLAPSAASSSSSSKNLSKVLFTSSKPVHQSLLPERALLRRDQIPNTPVSLSPSKYETRLQKDGLTRINGDGSLNRDDNGGISGGRASNDDRLPVVQLQPFTKKEWRPSNSIPISSSSSFSLLLSSVTSSSTTNPLFNRTLTSSEFANEEKKRRPAGLKTSLPKHKTKTAMVPVAAVTKADDRQFSKSKSAVAGISRSNTFLHPQPSTSDPKRDLTPKVVPKRIPPTAKPGPRAIRHPVTTASVPVRDGTRLTLAGTALTVASPSSTYIHDCIPWGSYHSGNAIRESGKSRSLGEDVMTRYNPANNHLPFSEVIYSRSKTLDSIADLRPRLRSRRTTNNDKSDRVEPSASFHFGVTNNSNLSRQRICHSGVESQLACILRVSLEEMRRNRPGLGLVSGLPSCFRSYEAFVESTYGEDRIRSALRHNARDLSKTKRTGLERNKTIPLVPQGPTRNYTLPDLFHFLKDSEDDSNSTLEMNRTEEGMSDERMAYNSRRTSGCSSRTSGYSGAGVAKDTASLSNVMKVISTETEDRKSVLSSISSRSEHFREETENCRPTNQNEEMSMKTVPRPTGLVVTVPIAKAPTENGSLETETMETQFGSVAEDNIVKLDAEVGGKMDAEHDMRSLEEKSCKAAESEDKMQSDIINSKSSSIPNAIEKKQSKEIETVLQDFGETTNKGEHESCIS